jgi:integrase/recombinase XerC
VGELIVITGDVTPAGASSDDQQMVGRMLAEWRSAATRREYTRDIARFFASRGELVASDEPAVMMAQMAAGIRRLCALRTSDVAKALADFKAGLRAQGLAPTTINRRLSAVRALLGLCRRYGWTEVDPTGLVDNETLGDLRRDVAGPSVPEMKRLLAAPDRTTAVGKRDYAILVLLCENLLRRAEICGLSIEHYDEKRRLLTVRRKRNKLETITLTKRVVAALDAHLEERSGGQRLDNGAAIFQNRTRNRLGRLSGSGLYKILNGYGARELGRTLGSHRLRHGGATAYAKKTRDPIGLQKLGGWSRLDTAMRYVDDAQDMQGQASEVLSKLFSQGE